MDEKLKYQNEIYNKNQNKIYEKKKTSGPLTLKGKQYMPTYGTTTYLVYGSNNICSKASKTFVVCLINSNAGKILMYISVPNSRKEKKRCTWRAIKQENGHETFFSLLANTFYTLKHRHVH